MFCADKYPNFDNLLKKNPIIFVDAGCAGGIDPTFNIFGNNSYTEAHGFEANSLEYENVLQKNKNDKVTFHNMALYDYDGQISFYSESSVGSVHKREDREKLFNEVYEKKDIPCRTLKSLSKDQTIKGSIDILKLDVEGSEVAVLKGAGDILEKDILCIKAEFEFDALKGRNGFAEIHQMMCDNGFQLMALAYNESMVSGLQAGDALYFRSPYFITKNFPDNRKKLKLLKLAAIASSLRYNEFSALIEKFADGMLSEKEIKELRQLTFAFCYLPELFAEGRPMFANIFFMLAQIFSGYKHVAKSGFKSNRLVKRLKPLYINPKLSWMKKRHSKNVEMLVESYFQDISLKSKNAK